MQKTKQKPKNNMNLFCFVFDAMLNGDVLDLHDQIIQEIKQSGEVILSIERVY